jgi:hypothetical protein
MEKGLFIKALILAMVLMSTPFPGNKAEAYYNSTSTYTGFSGSYTTSGGLYGRYSGYTSFGGLYGGYGGIYSGMWNPVGYGGIYGMGNPVGSGGGYMFLPARVDEPSYTVSDNGSGSSSPVSNTPQDLTQPVLGSSLPECIFIQNSQWPGPLNIFPAFIPSFDTAPITYPLYPLGSERPLFDLQAELLSTFVFPKTATFPPNPYRPDAYSTFPYPTPPGNIQSLW